MDAGTISVKFIVDKTYTRCDKIDNSVKIAVIISCEDMPARDKIHDVSMVLLIDVSGSMRTKIDIVKRSVRYLLDNMDASCEIAIVLFSGYARNLLSAFTTLDTVGKERILQELDDITTGGMTNMVDAVLAAVELIKTGVPPDFASHRATQVVLFTDGQHNTGDNFDGVYSALYDTMYERSVPFYTFSIGPEPDAPTLMKLAMMTAGGCYFHMNDINDIAGVFGSHIGAMKAMAVPRCRLTLDAPPGSRIIKIQCLSCAPHEHTRNKYYSIDLGPILSGTKKMFIINMSLRAADSQTTIQKILTGRMIVNDIVLSCDAFIGRSAVNGLVLSEADTHELCYAKIQHIFKTTVYLALQLAERRKYTNIDALIDGAIFNIRSEISGCANTPCTTCALQYIEALSDMQSSLLENTSQHEYSTACSRLTQRGGIYSSLQEYNESVNMGEFIKK